MDYFTILTDIGLSKIQAALTNESTINLTAIAVGDGNGISPVPSSKAISLLNEKYRVSVNIVNFVATSPNWIFVEAIIPRHVGNFYIRELGIIDSEGDLFAYGNYPETFKPISLSGSISEQYIRTIVYVTDAKTITVSVPSNAYPSKEELRKAIETHKQDRMSHPIATSSFDGFMSSSDKTKLDSLFTGFKINDSVITATNSAKYIELTGQNCIFEVLGNKVTITASTNANTLNGFTIDKFIMKGEHEGLGGSVHANATSTSNGFLSKEDKQKLDSISENAQENQFAFTKYKVGTVTLEATTKEDVLELIAGTGIELEIESNETVDRIKINCTVSPDGGDAATLNGKKWNDFAPISHVGSTGTAHGIASETTNGFMSTTHVTKLKSIEWNAQENIPCFSAIKVGSETLNATKVSDSFEVVAGENISLGVSGNILTITGSSNAKTLDGQNIDYFMKQSDFLKHKTNSDFLHNLATETESGFMSAMDKRRLDAFDIDAVNAKYLEGHPSAYFASSADLENHILTGTHPVATETSPGFMSVADKKRLEALARHEDLANERLVKNGTNIQIRLETDSNMTAGTVITLHDRGSNIVLFPIFSKCETINSHSVVGVIGLEAEAAIIMNYSLTNANSRTNYMESVVLKGVTKCKVFGPISYGDPISSYSDGMGRKNNSPYEEPTFAISMGYIADPIPVLIDVLIR